MEPHAWPGDAARRASPLEAPVGLRGGVSPVRRYIPDLLPDVLDGRINPGRVFDYETDLDGTPGAYAAMDERRAIKALIRIDTKETSR